MLSTFAGSVVAQSTHSLDLILMGMRTLEAGHAWLTRASLR